MATVALWVCTVAVGHLVAGLFLLLAVGWPRRRKEHDFAADGGEPSLSSSCSDAWRTTDGKAAAFAQAFVPTASAGRDALHQPVLLEWRGIGCSYQRHGKTVHVLRDVWGRAAPGEMQALMGPSGSGKTTLLDILSCRKTLGTIQGQLFANGHQLSTSSSFARCCAYVPQHDCFVPSMTCRETLEFHASLALPGSWSRLERAARVAQVLEILGISSSSTTLVGGRLPGGLLLRGLSGGERKRLSIAVGILSTPSIIFLDEPTSGLDSFAALSVCGHLQQMARLQQQAVLAAVHQPRTAAWQMFSQLTLLSSGYLMFHGPSSQACDWFSSLGFTFNPSRATAADALLDLVAVGFPKPARFYGNTFRDAEELAAAAEAFLDSYQQSSQQASSITPGLLIHSTAACDEDFTACDSDGTGQPECSGTTAAAAACNDGCTRSSQGCGGSEERCQFWAQFWPLLQREARIIMRNPFDSAGRALTFTWVGILIGLLFFNMPVETSILSLRNRPSLCFVCMWFVMLMPFVCVSIYADAKAIYLNDRSARLYRPLPYYAAKVAAATPFQVMYVLLFSWTVYGMVGLQNGAEHLLRFGLSLILLHMIATQVHHFAVIVSPNTDTAFMLSMLWTSIQVLFAGFWVIPADKVQAAMRWVSAMHFGLQALVTNEMQGSSIDCSAGMGASLHAFIISTLPALAGRLSPAMMSAVSRPQPGCVVRGDAIVSYFAFEGGSFGVAMAVLLAHLVGLHALTFVALVVLARQEAR